MWQILLITKLKKHIGIGHGSYFLKVRSRTYGSLSNGFYLISYSQAEMSVIRKHAKLQYQDKYPFRRN